MRKIHAPSQAQPLSDASISEQGKEVTKEGSDAQVSTVLDHAALNPISGANERAISAFIDHLRGREVHPDVQSETPPDDPRIILPALELFFNGCATLPGAHRLISHGLAKTEQREVATSFCAFALVTLEPTRMLHRFVSELIDLYHGESWFTQMLTGVLEYVARDEGEGACSTLRLANYAIENADAELLETLVDFETRAPFFRIGRKYDTPVAESLRLAAAAMQLDGLGLQDDRSWSGLEHRRSASVLTHDAADRQGTALQRADEETKTSQERFAMPPPRRLPAKQANFLYELLGLPNRETVTVGTLGQPLRIMEPSYSTQTPPQGRAETGVSGVQRQTKTHDRAIRRTCKA